MDFNDSPEETSFREECRALQARARIVYPVRRKLFETVARSIGLRRAANLRSGLRRVLACVGGRARR